MKAVVCPDWSADGPASRGSAQRTAEMQILRAIQQDANGNVPDSDTPRRWHKELFHLGVPLDYYAGNYRQVNAYMPCLNTNVGVGTTLGAPPQFVPQLMLQLFAKVRLAIFETEINWRTMSDEQKTKWLAGFTATLVGQFIRVHPFLNGNGRTSRLIWFWCLRRHGHPAQTSIIDRPRNPDYLSAMAEAMKANYGPLLIYVLHNLVATPRLTA